MKENESTVISSSARTGRGPVSVHRDVPIIGAGPYGLSAVAPKFRVPGFTFGGPRSMVFDKNLIAVRNVIPRR